MQQRSREAGEGALKAIFWMAILAAVIVFVVKYAPVRVAAAEFQDFMVERARDADRFTPEQLKKHLLDKATEMRLPITKDSCRVEKPGERVLMECDYEVEIDFIIMKRKFRFTPSVDQPIFLI